MSTTIRVATGAYPHTQALIDGSLTSAPFKIEHTALRPAHASFRPFVNGASPFDICELALVTYLIARERGRPLLGLPVVLMAQPELSLLVCREDGPFHSTEDLRGIRIGVRSYSQTTATWVRGILRDVYGIEPTDSSWSAFDAGHVDGYTDPPDVTRMPKDRSLLECLSSGELDAAIVSWDQRTTPGLRPLLDNAEDIEQAWRRSSGITPINHILCANTDVLRRNPSLTDTVVEVFKASREASKGTSDPGMNPGPQGLDANAQAIRTLVDYAFRQGITTRRLGLDELFAP